MNFRRSLFGYDAAAVQSKIEQMELHYAQITERLNNEISVLNRETAIINEKIARIEAEITSYQNMNEEIINILLAAHLEATEKVYQTMREAEQMSIDIRELLVKRERENEALKDTIKKYTEDVQAIALDYNNILEEFRNE